MTGKPQHYLTSTNATIRNDSIQFPTSLIQPFQIQNDNPSQTGTSLRSAHQWEMAACGHEDSPTAPIIHPPDWTIESTENEVEPVRLI